MPINKSPTIPVRTRFSAASALGVGPQIGYAFPVAGMQGFVGLRAYGDFDAANRAPGWSTWLTFAISPAEPTVAKPVRQMFTK